MDIVYDSVYTDITVGIVFVSTGCSGRQDISIFETLFKKVNESDFLQGINGEWKANFDWLLKQQSMVKVLEDQYINKHNQKNKESELVKNAIFGQNS